MPNSASTIDMEVSIVPYDAPAGGSYVAGEILLTLATDGSGASFIYASNRNLVSNDPRGQPGDLRRRRDRADYADTRHAGVHGPPTSPWHADLARRPLSPRASKPDGLVAAPAQIEARGLTGGGGEERYGTATWSGRNVSPAGF